MTEHSDEPTAELFYDGRCPLCTREICSLQKYAGHRLTMTDVHTLSNEDDKHRMLKTLHFRRDKEWLTGLDANIAMWQYTHFGLPWRLLRLPLIYSIASWAYRIWSKRRYNASYGKRV